MSLPGNSCAGHSVERQFADAACGVDGLQVTPRQTFGLAVDQIQAAAIVGNEIRVGFEIEHEQRLAGQFAGARRYLGAFARAARRFRHRNADDRFAGCDARQPLGLLVGAAGFHQRARHEHRGADERHRCDRGAERLCNHRRIERGQSDAAVRFRNDETRHAEVDETVPEILCAALAAVGEAARARETRVVGEKARQRVAEEFLFLRESEFHDQASLLSFGSFGMPRPRSLMMFF